MPKNKNAIVIKKDDWDRVLLSETTPAEMPILISNDGFYKNMSRNIFPKPLEAIINAFVRPSSEKRFSIPFSYRITKDANSLRRLALPHPRSQLEISSFYKRYHPLIPYYCGRGNFSIRRPEKIASHYYSEGKNEEVFRYKSQAISTPDTDKTAKHSVSVFSYYRFQRLYKFFSSPTFSNLERKYRYMESIDVSRCFDSIYTHSIAWAVKSKGQAKRSTKAESFGGQFDRLMQLMNYNETNGIIIGPEVSRIFAEIILNRVDVAIESNLRDKGYRLGDHYSIYRYVDNIYIFHNDEKVYSDIHKEIVASLEIYKMSLNVSKAEHSDRPFYTNKSMAISGAEEIRDIYIDGPVGTFFIDGSPIYYLNGYKTEAFRLQSYSNALRKACHLAQRDYESVAGYLIASLRARVQRVLRCRNKVEQLIENAHHPFDAMSVDEYRRLVARYLEESIDLCMHTYTLAPSVPCSLDIATILILAAETLERFGDDYILHIQERLQMWMARLMSSSSVVTLISNEHAVPIEVMNIVCALTSFGYDGRHFEEIISQTIPDHNEMSYFELVTTLFCLKDLPEKSPIINKLVKRAKNRILEDIDLRTSSEAMHIFLDLLSCPHIGKSERRALYRDTVAAYNKYLQSPDIGGRSLPVKFTNLELDEMLESMEKAPWFVSWAELDLLRLIEKKKLRSGYA